MKTAFFILANEELTKVFLPKGISLMIYNQHSVLDGISKGSHIISLNLPPFSTKLSNDAWMVTSDSDVILELEPDSSRSLSDLSTYFYLKTLGCRIHPYHHSILSHACKNGFIDLAKWIIGKGLDIRFRYNAALRKALKYGHYELADLLIANGADISDYYSYKRDEMASWIDIGEETDSDSDSDVSSNLNPPNLKAAILGVIGVILVNKYL